MQLILVILLSAAVVVSAGSTSFDKHDLPEPIEPSPLDEAEFAPLIAPHDNSIEKEDQDEDCPLSARQNNDDWQIIELPHSDPQFDHVDHLPMMKMIDYTWPASLKKKKFNKYNNNNNNNQQQHYGSAKSGFVGFDDEWKKPIKLDARKLFLEKKFHYKSKLPLPPTNYINRQQVIATNEQQPIKPSIHVTPKPPATYLDAIVHMDQPMVTMFANQKTTNKLVDTQEQVNELTQQQDPLLQFERHHQVASIEVTTGSPKTKSVMDMLELNYASGPVQSTTAGDPPAQVNRARGSFQAAAEIAKQLDNERALKESAEIREGSGVNCVETFNLTSSARPADQFGDLMSTDWDVETATRSGLNTSMAPEVPKYLGYGQIYKTDNSRSTTQQARLSCSFGLEQQDADASANVTISDVQWMKIVGNYDPDQLEPPFECKYRSCRMFEVKNDIWTTVHPRPAVQQYLGERAGQTMPSYSVTIHQVDAERHTGVYRCSAVRHLDGGATKQLVYRIVPFT